MTISKPIPLNSNQSVPTASCRKEKRMQYKVSDAESTQLIIQIKSARIVPCADLTLQRDIRQTVSSQPTNCNVLSALELIQRSPLEIWSCQCNDSTVDHLNGGQFVSQQKTPVFGWLTHDCPNFRWSRDLSWTHVPRIYAPWPFLVFAWLSELRGGLSQHAIFGHINISSATSTKP